MKVGAWLRATHPGPALFVTLLTTFVVRALGASEVECALALVSTACGQASVGWVNDHVDRFRDRGAGRRDKPVAEGAIEPRTLFRVAVAAATASIVAALPLGLVPALEMGVAVASAWLYSVKLKFTWFSWTPYLLSFGLLPVFSWAAARDSVPPPWIVAAAGGLGVAAHLMNTIPDLGADIAAGVRGLPHHLGETGSLTLAAGILAAELLLVALRTDAFDHPTRAQVLMTSLAAGLILAAGVSTGTKRARLGWYVSMAAIGAIAALLVVGLERAGLGAL
jgi:4-hydroxybenzoate polyprenyltransferase